MTNPQLARSLLAMIRSLPDEDRRWLVEQLDQETDKLSSGTLARLTMAGGAFDVLAGEPDLHSIQDGEPIHAPTGC